MILKNKVLKIAGYIITIIAFVFIIKTVISMKLDLTQIKNPITAVIWLVIISIGFCAIVFISAFAWKMILEFINNSKILFKVLLPVYVKANIGKYLPGNVMHFAGRNIMAGRLGFKQLDIAFSSVVEIIALVFTACFWSFLLSMNKFISIIGNAVAKLNLILVITIFIFAVMLVAILVWKFIVKEKYYQKFHHFLTKSFFVLLFKLFLIYSFTMLVSGFSLAIIFHFIMQSTISISTLMIIVSAYTISWVAGYIVPGAPGGIGVRESILLLLLGTSFSAETVLIAILLHRMTSIIGDMIAFFIQPIISKRIKLKS
jgi:uncharacterized membrane protein YbhN (UPF0104 family)